MRLALLFALAACSSHPPRFHADSSALAWRSRSKVPDEAAKRITDEMSAAARSRPPWHEANHLHAADGSIGDGRDKYLFGEVQLHLSEYESKPGAFREVDPRDDAVMALADADFTVRELQKWSRDYGIEWDVQAGTDRSRVDKDTLADGVLAALAKKAGISPQAAESERAAIDSKYRDRH